MTLRKTLILTLPCYFQIVSTETYFSPRSFIFQIREVSVSKSAKCLSVSKSSKNWFPNRSVLFQLINKFFGFRPVCYSLFQANFTFVYLVCWLLHTAHKGCSQKKIKFENNQVLATRWILGSTWEYSKHLKELKILYVEIHVLLLLHSDRSVLSKHWTR